MKTSLFVFYGLPGTVKTVLSLRLASHLKAVHLRIDTIEQALRDLCGIVVEGEGYRLAYRIAADNLRLGVRPSVEFVQIATLVENSRP